MCGWVVMVERVGGRSLGGVGRTLSTGDGIGTRQALRTADSDGIAAAMVPVPVLLWSGREFHANDVEAVAESNTVTRKKQHYMTLDQSIAERVRQLINRQQCSQQYTMCCISLASVGRGVVARLFATGQITCERAGPVPSSCLSRASGARKKQAQQPARSQPCSP